MNTYSHSLPAAVAPPPPPPRRRGRNGCLCIGPCVVRAPPALARPLLGYVLRGGRRRAQGPAPWRRRRHLAVPVIGRGPGVVCRMSSRRKLASLRPASSEALHTLPVCPVLRPRPLQAAASRNVETRCMGVWRRVGVQFGVLS
ncbi:unspecified product [Leishmania tarentolae]|uniref:Unspecified product n=1 Tax=Leishmania tarentolae TaxID=5689 RepID=A0A640KZ96_LEITA|nr:unspecified product [Leishmania tarentolae]